MVKNQGLSRLLSGLGAVVLLLALTAQVFLPGKVSATANAIGTPRSLTLVDGPSAGGSQPGGTVNHEFNFLLNEQAGSPPPETIGSITFQYCTTADPVTGGVGCDGPTGLDLSGASVADEAGTNISGWTVVANSAVNNVDSSDSAYTLDNQITIGLSATVSAPQDTNVIEELTNVINPSTPNTTFYVRITAYSSLDGTGAATDSGTVAASTANAIALTGYMPESLVFCTGQYVPISDVTDLPECADATAGSVSFNQLFDPNTTTWATSQMAASTNANNGYAITVAGKTLYSGTTPIAAIGSTATVSVPGTAQFGMNLIDDYNPTTPVVTDPTIGNGSADPITYYESDGSTPDPNGGALYPASVEDGNDTGLVTSGATGFDGSNDSTNHYPTYSFAGSNALNIIAQSNDTTSTDPGPTNSQRYTATYIVNVPGNQPAGTYDTTLTYICTPTY